jgi:hypothetical protein
METAESKPLRGFLRQEEMNSLIESEKDPITADLMNQAAHIVVLRVIRHEEGPISDFDLRYFMEIIQEFASDHEILKRSLEGKRCNEEWLPENDG